MCVRMCVCMIVIRVFMYYFCERIEIQGKERDMTEMISSVYSRVYTSLFLVSFLT